MQQFSNRKSDLPLHCKYSQKSWLGILRDVHSLKLFFFNKTTVIIVQDCKNLLYVLLALFGEATHLEERLGAESV